MIRRSLNIQSKLDLVTQYVNLEFFPRPHFTSVKQLLRWSPRIPARPVIGWIGTLPYQVVKLVTVTVLNKNADILHTKHSGSM